MVSGSCACTSMGKPKSLGRLPLTSRQFSPASSLRMTCQCVCMNSTFRVVGRRLQVPDPLELPRVLRAVVPHVRGERLARLGGRVVDELVALGLGHSLRRRGRLALGGPRLLPCLAAVAGALDDLPEPAA